MRTESASRTLSVISAAVAARFSAENLRELRPSGVGTLTLRRDTSVEAIPLCDGAGAGVCL